jgi:hypothetical protein
VNPAQNPAFVQSEPKDDEPACSSSPFNVPFWRPEGTYHASVRIRELDARFGLAEEDDKPKDQ